jgi:phosphate acetyltransferase
MSKIRDTRQLIERIKQRARTDKKVIVFPESTDYRILKGCRAAVQQGIASPVLIGEKPEIEAAADKLGVSLDGIQIVSSLSDPQLDLYIESLVRLREHKGMTKAEAQRLLSSSPMYFGTMMVQTGDADGLIGGATTTTADTLRPALQIIKTHEKFHKVSGLFLMYVKGRLLFLADCAVNIEPSSHVLAEIAIDTKETVKKFGIEPRVAMISFSTNGSADHPSVERVREATAMVREKAPELIVDGEMQVDAALEPETCQRKYPGSKIRGNANVLIFPGVAAGNIGYKLLRTAGADAVGPILQGLKKPVNDLSRGCNIQDVIDVCAITVLQAQNVDADGNYL